MIVHTKAAEHALLQKMAAATKVPRKYFIKEPLLSSTTLEPLPVFTWSNSALSEQGISYEPVFYCVSSPKINLLQLLDPEQWDKHDLHYEFNLGQQYVPLPAQWRYHMAVQAPGTVLVISAWDKDLPLSGLSSGVIIVRSSLFNKYYSITCVKQFVSTYFC